METAVVAGLIGALSGAAVASIISAIAENRRQKTANAHELAVAREQRGQTRMERVYERVIEEAFRLETWAARTLPILEPAPDPPAPLSDHDLFRLNALVGVYASDQVQKLTRSLSDAAREVQGLAWQADFEKKRGRPVDHSEWMPAQQAVREAVQELVRRTNAELRSGAD